MTSIDTTRKTDEEATLDTFSYILQAVLQVYDSYYACTSNLSPTPTPLSVPLEALVLQREPDTIATITSRRLHNQADALEAFLGV